MVFNRAAEFSANRPSFQLSSMYCDKKHFQGFPSLFGGAGGLLGGLGGLGALGGLGGLFG